MSLLPTLLAQIGPIEATPAWPALGALFILALLTAAVWWSALRERSENAELKERLAAIVGNDAHSTPEERAQQSTFAWIVATLERANAENAARQQEAENERKARAELYVELWNLRDMLATLRTDAQTAQQRAESEREDLMARLRGLEGEIGELKGMLDSRDGELVAERKAKEEALAEAHRLRAEVQRLQAELQQLQGRVATLENVTGGAA